MSGTLEPAQPAHLALHDFACQRCDLESHRVEDQTYARGRPQFEELDPARWGRATRMLCLWPMIGYPFTWKAELKHQLRQTQAYLRRAEATRRRGPEFEDASAWLEYLVLIAAFTVRRLIEAEALSHEVCAKTIPLTRFARRPDAPTLHFRNRQEVGLHYALGSPEETSLELRELCNTLIHSYLLMDCATSGNAGELIGLIVTADRSRNEHCLFLRLDDLLPVIEAVANDGFDMPYEPHPESFPPMLRDVSG